MTSTRRGFLAGTAALCGLTLAGCRTLHATTTGSLPGAGSLPGDARRAFLAAVEAGRTDEVRRLLVLQPDLAGTHDDAGRSAVVLACLGMHGDVRDALLEHVSELSLVEACMVPDWERAVALGEADPTQVDAWHPVGGTAVYAALRAGHSIWRLQALGGDPDGNPLGPRGVTPAYGAIECVRAPDALRSAVAALSNGGHVNARQRQNDSVLHAAARRGDVPLVRYLLRRGADVLAIDARGRTPQDLADRAGHADVAALLADPARVPRDDMTTRYAYDASGAPVQWPDISDLSRAEQGAVTGPSHFDLAAVREAVGDEPRRSFSRSTQDELAVEACGHTGQREILRYHLDHGVPQSLCTSLSVGDLDRARALLEQHPNAIHERGPHDFAPMFYPAIGGGSLAAAALLLEHGADVDQDSQGTTGLHWAVRRGRVDLAAFLLENGADVEAVGYQADRQGQTPMQMAQAGGRDELVRLLADHGARDAGEPRAAASSGMQMR